MRLALNRPDMKGSPDDDRFLPRVPPLELAGDERLEGSTGASVLDYWRWAYSDVLENVQRGIFAEYLIAAALGVTHVRRIGWAGYDLNYAGKKIEVKSSAYLQSWIQRRLSRPSFSIGERQQFIEETGGYEDPRYVADCYVFCLYNDQHGPTANILDVGRWAFYALNISTLIRHFGTAKSLSLKRLQAITTPVAFAGLRSRVDDAIAEVESPPVDAAVGPAEGVTVVDATHTRAKQPRVYRVCKRKTYEHSVIVTASNYRDARLLARPIRSSLLLATTFRRSSCQRRN